MSDGPRYATLQDYLRVLRRHRLLVALVTVGFMLVALAYSVAKEPTYEATAQISFRDALQDLSLLGIDTTPEEAPPQRAASNAEIVTRPEVTKRVQKELETDLSQDELANAITTEVGTQTNLVTLQASATNADFAARLANSYARQAQIVGSREQRQRLDEAEQSLLREAKGLQDGGGDNPGISGLRQATLDQQLTRVQTLQQIAQPVEIAQRAAVPSSPASPDPVRDTIIGAVIGLVIGLVAAFVRETLDRRLHNAGEVHHELEMPILGRVADTALGYAGLARNGPVTMRDTDFEAFRVLRTNLGFLGGGEDLHSILVTSGGPEEGKSTVSMSLASAAALGGQRVLLVECDLRRPSFARRLGIPPAPGLSDYLVGRAEPQDILQTVELSEPDTWNGAGQEQRPAAASLVCIAAGSRGQRPAELLGTERFADFLAKVSKAYDLVVLDSSPLLLVVDPLQIVPQVDGVILCVRVLQTTREQARAARAALDRVPERPTGAVVTGLRRGDPEAYEYYYGSY